MSHPGYRHLQGQAMKQETRSTSARTTQLNFSITEVNRMVQMGCNEVSSISQLAQAWLLSPEGLRDTDVVTNALRTIQHSAERLATYVEDEIYLLRHTTKPEV